MSSSRTHDKTVALSIQRLFTLLVAVSALMLPFSHSKAQTGTAVGEYQVKAAFLFNFVKFVDWPTTAFESETSPYVIGVLGSKDPFGDVLDKTFEGKTVNGRPFVVKRFDSFSKTTACHVLFISATERRRVTETLEAAQDAPILTVGELDHFAEQGGVINFVKEGNKIRFQINVEAAKRANLRIHSTLLNLAKIVRSS